MTQPLKLRKCSDKKSSTYVLDIQIFRDQKFSVYDFVSTRPSADLDQYSSSNIT